MTDSFGWVIGLGAHLVEEALEGLGAVGVVVADRHRDDDPRVELGDQLGRPGRRQRATERHAGDVHRADVAELLLRQQVADVAEVDGVDAVDLDDERDLLAGLGAAGVVAVGPDAGDQDLLDLVLARAVEHERGVQAGRQERATVARLLALGPRERAIVGVTEGDDVAGDPTAGRPDDRLEWIADDDGVLAAQPDARAPIPSEFHRFDSDTAPCIAACPRPPTRQRDGRPMRALDESAARSRTLRCARSLLPDRLRLDRASRRFSVGVTPAT